MSPLEVELAEVLRQVKHDICNHGHLEDRTIRMVEIHLQRFDFLNKREKDEYSDSKASESGPPDRKTDNWCGCFWPNTCPNCRGEDDLP